MPVILFLKILGAIAAVALGFFLGAGNYSQSQEEIEFRMGGGKPRRAKRHFMWLDMLKTDKRGSERRRTRGAFQTAVSSEKPVPRAKVAPRKKVSTLPKAWVPEEAAPGGATATDGATPPDGAAAPDSSVTPDDEGRS